MSGPDLFAFAVSASTVAGRRMAPTPAKTKRGKRVAFIVYEGETTRRRRDQNRQFHPFSVIARLGQQRGGYFNRGRPASVRLASR